MKATVILMKNNSRRMGISVLLCTLLLGTIASCGGEQPSAVQTDAVNQGGETAAPAETAVQYGDALPEDLDF